MSWWRSKRKTQNSCFFPFSLCSSRERLPCDLPDPSLWLTEGTAALLISPLTLLCVACHTVAPLPGGEDGGEGGLHQGETLPVGSRQFQAIAPCSLGFCLHTRTNISKQMQMTINGYNNVLCFLMKQ